jgi:hypothetical protein
MSMESQYWFVVTAVWQQAETLALSSWLWPQETLENATWLMEIRPTVTTTTEKHLKQCPSSQAGMDVAA